MREKISKIWNDPVWSKVIAYFVVGLTSIFVSGIATYLKSPTDARKEESIIGVLLSYNLSINLFVILSTLTFLVMVTIGFLYKKFYLHYDLFISAPMSGFKTNEEYEEFRKLCIEVKYALENKCGFKKIYYAGADKPTKADFSIPKVAFIKDLIALRKSKRFMLIHPGKIYSSTLFECGFAYRKQMKCVYFVKYLTDLPFLMRHLADAASFVSIICVEDIKNILKVINTDKSDIYCNLSEKWPLLRFYGHEQKGQKVHKDDTLGEGYICHSNLMS